MSLFSSIPEDQLEVLLVIFDYLDAEDLRRCEAVCQQWRNVLLNGITWRRLFNRLIVSSPQWRQVWRNFVPDENELQTARYRSLCRTIMQQLKPVDRNWRTGNYKIITNKVPYLADCWFETHWSFEMPWTLLIQFFIDQSQKISPWSSIKLISLKFAGKLFCSPGGSICTCPGSLNHHPGNR
jgi:F-box-like